MSSKKEMMPADITENIQSAPNMKFRKISEYIGVTGIILDLAANIVGSVIKVSKTILSKAGKDELADKIGFLSKKTDAAFVDKWARNLFKHSDNFMINFDLINEYREYLLPKKKFPAAWIPVPPNMERGFFINGRLIDGKSSKTFLFSSLHMNPSLLASAYRETNNQAIATGAIMSLSVFALLHWILGDMIALDYTAAESWGSYGSAQFFSLKNLLITSPVALICSAIVASPLLFMLRIARAEHDVIAFNETYADIERQIKHYEGDIASQDAVTVYHMDSDLFSPVRAEQLKNFWRVYKSGQPLIKSLIDDGTARARGIIHGLEAGTQILMSLEDKCTNTLVTGKIGGGKTTKFALPDFSHVVDALMEKGYPIQGSFLDGKAGIHNKIQRMLKKKGFPVNKFVEIGLGAGSYGCPIFEGLTPEVILGILPGTQPGIKDDFFNKAALTQLLYNLHVAGAYDQTPMGVDYEINNGGIRPYSPLFVQRLTNDPEFLFNVIAELTDYFKKDDRARKALYTTSLRNAISGCLTSWKNYLKAEEMVNGIIASMNVYLSPFTKVGEICDRFGSGRSGADYKDPRIMMEGYFCFITLSTAEFPDAARAISAFWRARTYNALKDRAVHFEKLGKDPQTEPIILNIDEHPLLVSGGIDGLSDASIFNVSRSMGLCFTGLAQSVDAYVMAIGEIQTENMSQNLVNRIMFPTTSKRDQDYIAHTFGTRYELNVGNGIYATEGSRELKNGGVMTIPRTEIRKVTSLAPMGMPEPLSKVSQDEIDDAEKSLPCVYLPFSMSPYSIDTSHMFFTMISERGDLNDFKKSRIRFGTTGFLGGYDSRPVLSLLDGDSAQERAEKKATGGNQISRTMGKKDQKVDYEGVSRVPLFTQDDFIYAGSSYAIARLNLFGHDYSMRAKLDGIYI